VILAGCIASWSRWMTNSCDTNCSRSFQRAGFHQVRWWEKSLFENQSLQLALRRHRTFICVLSFIHKARCTACNLAFAKLRVGSLSLVGHPVDPNCSQLVGLLQNSSQYIYIYIYIYPHRATFPQMLGPPTRVTLSFPFACLLPVALTPCTGRRANMIDHRCFHD
jgi:hypothetical protein